MLIQIRVDHIALICIWRYAHGINFGVMAEDLDMPQDLRERIEDWMDRHEELRKLPDDDDTTHAAWMAYDATGRGIADELRPYLAGANVVEYYSEAYEAYE